MRSDGSRRSSRRSPSDTWGPDRSGGAPLTHDSPEEIAQPLALKEVALVLWVLTMLWLPILVVAEATHLRLSYNVRRWSTVFPVGMYAACSFVVGAVTGTRAITDFADVWVWVGVAVWSVVFVAMIRRGRALALADSRSSSSRSR